MTKQQFLGINNTISSTNTTSNSATFTDVNLINESIFVRTTLNNVQFFINGVYVSPSAIISMENSQRDLIVVFDVSILGYTLTSTDAVVGVGKFNIL